MSVSNFVCLAALVMAFGSCKKDIAGESGETGSLEAKIIFGGTGTRTTSTAIPVTSWSKINQIQMFLYDPQGNVKFSDTIRPPQTVGSIQRTWSMVPAGSYTLTLVANAKSSTDPVVTMVGGLEQEWTGMNVRNRAISGLNIKHKPMSAFPTLINTALGAGHTLKPFEAPAEVFMAHAINVVITSGATTDITSAPLRLKREVALMRVRLRVSDQSQGFNNADVKFNHADASLMVYTLPDHINIHQDSTAGGGVSTTSNDQAVLLAAHGPLTFSDQDPSATTHTPQTILDTEHRLWREVVVFPNNGGRLNPKADAPATQRYYVVVTAHAPQGHLLGNGNPVTNQNGELVHWGGLVEASFEPNTIRELNLNLSSGGTIGIPTEPAKEGGLIIQVNDPLPWDSNIKVTNIDL
jgi:hypothetical protein